MSPQKELRKPHFASAVIYRKTREGLEFLILNSVLVDPRSGQKSGIKTKFPGGMQKGPRETVVKTMSREVREETGLVVRGRRNVWKQSSPSDPNHVQFAFLIDIDDCRGILRTEPMVDGCNELSPPRWVSAQILKRGGLFYPHHEVFLAALRVLGQ